MMITHLYLRNSQPAPACSDNHRCNMLLNGLNLTHRDGFSVFLLHVNTNIPWAFRVNTNVCLAHWHSGCKSAKESHLLTFPTQIFPAQTQEIKLPVTSSPTFSWYGFTKYYF